MVKSSAKNTTTTANAAKAPMTRAGALGGPSAPCGAAAPSTGTVADFGLLRAPAPSKYLVLAVASDILSAASQRVRREIASLPSGKALQHAGLVGCTRLAALTVGRHPLHDALGLPRQLSRDLAELHETLAAQPLFSHCACSQRVRLGRRRPERHRYRLAGAHDSGAILLDPIHPLAGRDRKCPEIATCRLGFAPVVGVRVELGRVEHRAGRDVGRVTRLTPNWAHVRRTRSRGLAFRLAPACAHLGPRGRN